MDAGAQRHASGSGPRDATRAATSARDVRERAAAAAGAVDDANAALDAWKQPHWRRLQESFERAEAEAEAAALRCALPRDGAGSETAAASVYSQPQSTPLVPMAC